MQLRTEIEINAPPHVVWSVLADRAAYQEWNPFITSFEGPLEEGARASIVVSPPDSSDFHFRPKLLRVIPNEELRWRGNLLFDFLFSGEHYIKLSLVGPDRTRVAHGEDFGGFFLKFLLRHMGATQRGFVYMNEALKRRAEAVFATTGSKGD